MKNTYKYLFKNSLLLMLASLGTSFVSFFLVPVYTGSLKTDEYGIIDLIDFSALLFFYIICLDFSDVVSRFSIDDKNEKKTVLKIGLKIYCISLAFALLIIIFILHFNVFSWEKHFYYFLYLQYTLFSLNLILTQYLKGLDKVNIITLSGLVSVVVRLLCVLVFLYKYHLGIDGYYYASFISLLCSIIICLLNISNFFEAIKTPIIHSIEKEMLKYSIPMAINALGWWIAQGVDKYFVAFYCGYDVNGIYSVSYKIPSLLMLICTVFSQAFGISAIKELSNENSSVFYRNTYKVFFDILSVSCSLLILGSVYFTQILYSKEYYEAWTYTSYLIISTLFIGLGSMLGGIIDAQKNVKILAFSTLVAAIINVGLNILLIPRFGALGAAASTFVSMYFIYIIRIYSIEKTIKLRTNRIYEYMVFILLIVQVYLNQSLTHMYIYQGLILSLISLLVVVDVCMIKKGE